MASRLGSARDRTGAACSRTPGVRIIPPITRSAWTFVGWTLCGTLALALLVRLALRAWFVADDFLLLLLVQAGESPWASLWPVETRTWWAYRPLGTELYFAAAQRLFGYWAGGYHLTTLLVHIGSSVLLARCGRALGLRPATARLAGALYFVAPPLAVHVMRACTFHYQIATLFLLASLLLHLRWLATDKWRLRAASAAAFCAGLLCNQLIFAMPVLAFLTRLFMADKAGIRARLWAALRAAWPYGVLGFGAWAVERFVFKQVPRQGWYGFFPDEALPARLAELATLLVGRWPGTWVALGILLLALLWVRWGRDPATAPVPGPLAQAGRLAGVWLSLMLGVAPFVFLVPHVRYVFPAVAPLCLLVAVGAELGLRGLSSQAGRSGARLVLFVLWTPWGLMWSGPLKPSDAPYKAAHELVQERMPRLDRRLLFVYGAPGLADADDLWRYRFLSAGFAHVRMLRPGFRPNLETVDLRERVPELTSGDLVIGLRQDLMPMVLGRAQLLELARAAERGPPPK